jgi:hypothetical protein
MPPRSPARNLELTVPCRVHYDGRSAPAGPLVYAVLVCLVCAAGCRVPLRELARAVGAKNPARVCGAANKTLRALGHPARVRVDGGDVVLSDC